MPAQGSVLFDGEDIAAKGLEHHRRYHISLIFQSYNLIDYMTPIENVQLTAKLDAAPILQRLGLEQDEMTRNVLKLSGGQQQRVVSYMADLVGIDRREDKENAAYQSLSWGEIPSTDIKTPVRYLILQGKYPHKENRVETSEYSKMYKQNK